MSSFLPDPLGELTALHKPPSCVGEELPGRVEGEEELKGVKTGGQRKGKVWEGMEGKRGEERKKGMSKKFKVVG